MVTGKFSEMSKPKTVYQGQVRPDIDRGWAWIVMIATYLGMTVYCTTLYMNGILYIALLDRYREGEAKTSLVGAVSSGLLCYSGIVLNSRSLHFIMPVTIRNCSVKLMHMICI